MIETSEVELQKAWQGKLIPAVIRFNRTTPAQALCDYARRLELGRFTRGSALAQVVAIEARRIEELSEKLGLVGGFPVTIISHAYNYAPATAYIADAFRRGLDELVLRRGEAEIVGRPGQKIPGVEFAIFSTYGFNPVRSRELLEEDPSGVRIVWGVNADTLDKEARASDAWAHKSKANGEGINELVFRGAQRFIIYAAAMKARFGDPEPLPMKLQPLLKRPISQAEAFREREQQLYRDTLDSLLGGEKPI